MSGRRSTFRGPHGVQPVQGLVQAALEHGPDGIEVGFRPAADERQCADAASGAKMQLDGNQPGTASRADVHSRRAANGRRRAMRSPADFRQAAFLRQTQHPRIAVRQQQGESRPRCRLGRARGLPEPGPGRAGRHADHGRSTGGLTLAGLTVMLVWLGLLPSAMLEMIHRIFI